MYPHIDGTLVLMPKPAIPEDVGSTEADAASMVRRWSLMYIGSD